MVEAEGTAWLGARGAGGRRQRCGKTGWRGGLVACALIQDSTVDAAVTGQF